jgi:RHH-type rel operon transcriptional repressor/antitoxin RelB
MRAVRLSEDTEARLMLLSERTGRSKSYYIRKAVESFLEDKEDYLLAMARLEQSNARIPFETVRRLVELED